MTVTFLNVPYWLWGIGCLGIAALYAWLWPKPKPGQTRPAGRQWILRWAHALVWVLLAAVCFVLALNTPALTPLANVLGLAALACYGLFSAALLIDRRR